MFFPLGGYKQTFKRVFVVVLSFTAVVFCVFWLRNKGTICFFGVFFYANPILTHKTHTQAMPTFLPVEKKMLPFGKLFFNGQKCGHRLCVCFMCQYGLA